MINLVSRNLNQSFILTSKKARNQLQKLFLIQSNNICHKDELDPEQTALRLPPFPYKEKRLTYLHKVGRIEGFNATIGRFTENTKVVVVEGKRAVVLESHSLMGSQIVNCRLTKWPLFSFSLKTTGNVGAGKGALAKKLAEDLGMKFFPDVTPDDEYRTADGFDWRDLNKHLHEDVWYADHKMVLETRNPFLAGYWEMSMLRMRTYNYLSALTHMLNTGDGVVLERSAWAGTVFARTLKDLNLVSHDYLTHYWDIRSAAFTRMYRPHVVIYLDVPVDKCLENARRLVSALRPFDLFVAKLCSNYNCHAV